MSIRITLVHEPLRGIFNNSGTEGRHLSIAESMSHFDVFLIILSGTCAEGRHLSIAESMSHFMCL